MKWVCVVLAFVSVLCHVQFEVFFGVGGSLFLHVDVERLCLLCNLWLS